uniref:Uncharacterized protein n=1 Tax=Avena sativa TaxID=4498 RepID=A0ACD5UGP7_AVESA
MTGPEISSSDLMNLVELRSRAETFGDKIRSLSHYGLKGGLLMETGEESTGRSGGESQQQQQHKSSTSEIKHVKSPPPAVSPPMPMAAGGSMGGHSPIAFLGPASGLDSYDVLRDAGAIIGRSEDEILEERIKILAGAILYKCEAHGCDLARMLEVNEIQKQAEVALKFGFDFELLGKDIDKLRHELRRIVSIFSPDNRDVRRSMIMLANEPCLSGVAKLRWISGKISMLRRMDLDLDSEVKSRMLKLKSESYLSYLEKEECSIGKGVTGEATTFAAYRLCWERHWGNGYSFEDQTLLSSMQFTHCKPSCVPLDAVAGSTLQIYSIKVSIKEVLEEVAWPLNVYGVVSARDSVDRQRNPIFIRTRNYCQVLSKDDPFLHLTGPVRGIVSMGTVYIETELKAKGRRSSEDIVLASTVINSSKRDNFSTSLADNKHCTIELCFEELENSVQATIVSIVVKSKQGSAPFPYGGKILCSSLPSSGVGDIAGIQSRQAVIFDSVDGELIKERAGHLDLNRRVLSVELGDKLQFHIQRYSQPGFAEVDAQVLLFTPNRWNISRGECSLDDGSVAVITLAWSLVPSKLLTC